MLFIYAFSAIPKYMGQCMSFRYLLYLQAVKPQASLRICADPPSAFAARRYKVEMWIKVLAKI